MSNAEILRSAHVGDGRGFTDIVESKPQQSILLFDEWTLKKENAPNAAMLTMKCVALNHLMRSRSEFDEKFSLYQRLQSCVNHEAKHWKICKSERIEMTLLTGAIYLFCDNNPMQIVAVFERLQTIAFQQKCRKTKKFFISLRMFLPVQSQFVLRYLFGFKAKEIVQHLAVNKEQKLRVIVGKGLRTSGSKNNQQRLAQFVVDELSKWEPPICALYKDGNIFIDRDAIIHYAQNEGTNYAALKLINPSKDWYLD